MQVTSLTNSHNKAENYLLSICLWAANEGIPLSGRTQV